jgi:hypothetical protein
MEEKDKTIRMQWIIGLALSPVISIGNSLYEMQRTPLDPFFPHLDLVIFSILLISTFGFSFIFYRCAYKKPGTKLLLFSLILNGFSAVFNLIAHLTDIIPLPAHVAYSSLSLIFNTALGAIWFILCWRMRQLNQKLKRLIPMTKL